ncbi:MAG: lecithin retinol acyltransferase family protein [Oleispira sp.]|nr:lecithin retinol acyltransferase family protein [Oleispira sp.]MBL4880554.1 lecithin retinol acyltransferase family protein [Oleispira sp.]
MLYNKKLVTDFEDSEGNTLIEGDHLVSSRGVYSHHGIYIGGGQVIHYAGMSSGFSKDCVERTTVREFAAGNDVTVKSHLIRVYGKYESIERANSRLGENEYNLLTNNCESFVLWCIQGIPLSSQVLSAAAITVKAAQIANAARVGSVMAPPIVRTVVTTGSSTLGSTMAASTGGMAGYTAVSTGGVGVSGFMAGAAAGPALLTGLVVGGGCYLAYKAISSFFD